MPTYTYQCKACEETHEVFHAMSANPKVKCPVCGKACKRLLGTGAGIIFKGSGFYETDYKKDGGTKAAKSGGSAESKAEKKAESAAPAKSESKSTASESSKASSSK